MKQSIMRLNTTASPVYRRSGPTNGFARELERLLLDVLAHRTATEMSAIVAALARGSNGEVREILREAQGRLDGFVRLQDLLRAPRFRTRIDGCAYLRQLCEALSFWKPQPHLVRLEFVERPLRIDSEQCWLLGMIVAELVTSAASHASAQSPGWIRVDVEPIGSYIQCKVENNGSGCAQLQPPSGLRIVESMAKALDGGVVRLSGLRGSVFTLIFPVVPSNDWTRDLLEE
jgi:two-component sensor histidine kinase